MHALRFCIIFIYTHVSLHSPHWVVPMRPGLRNPIFSTPMGTGTECYVLSQWARFGRSALQTLNCCSQAAPCSRHEGAAAKRRLPGIGDCTEPAMVGSCAAVAG
jgi:hypothetical protein